MAMDAVKLGGGDYRPAKAMEVQSSSVRNTPKIEAPEVKDITTQSSLSEGVLRKAEPALKSNKEDVKGNKDEKNLQVSEKRTDQERDKMKKMVEQINKQFPDSEAVFGIHDQTNRVTIKIVNKDTKEVIKEYPPEQTLDMIAKVWELAGLMVDEKR